MNDVRGSAVALLLTCACAAPTNRERVEGTLRYNGSEKLLSLVKDRDENPGSDPTAWGWFEDNGTRIWVHVALEWRRYDDFRDLEPDQILVSNATTNGDDRVGFEWREIYGDQAEAIINTGDAEGDGGIGQVEFDDWEVPHEFTLRAEWNSSIYGSREVELDWVWGEGL